MTKSSATYARRIPVAGTAFVCGVLAGYYLAAPARAQRVAAQPVSPVASPAPPAAPSLTAKTPEPCRVGVYVTALSDLNLVTKSFHVDFWAWGVSPKLDKPLTTLEILNAQKTDTLYDSSVQVADKARRFGTNGTVFYSQRKYLSTVRYDWNETNYPFDRHVLRVEMEDALNDASSVAFQPDTANTRLDKSINPDGWKIMDMRLSAHDNIYDTTFGDPRLADGKSTFSHLTLALTIERTSRASFWVLTLGVYAAFLLSLITFYYDPDQAGKMGGRFGILSGALFAAIVSLRGTDAIIGHTEGLTLIAKIHLATILYILLGGVATIISHNVAQRGGEGGAKRALRLDRRVFLPALLVSYVAVIAAMAWYAASVG